MALETFYDSNFHLAALNTGFPQLPNCDNSLEEHEQYEASAVSLLNAASGNSMHTSSRIGNSHVGSIPLTVGLNSRENSLLRDAGFAIPEGSNLNGIVTTDMGSNFNFAQQPALFSSQQTSLLTPKRLHVAGRKQQQKGLTAKHQNSVPSRVNQDLINVNQRHKKPRLDINEKMILGQLISEHGQQSQQSKRNTHKHQLSGLVQHHMLQSGNKLEASQSVPQYHGVFVQPCNQLTSDEMQQQVVDGAGDEQQPDEGVFTNRLMQYLNHLRNRPPDNDIAYWRKFIAEYFAPGAIKRWCVSLNDEVGTKTTSIIPKSATKWQCDMCGCKAGRGFEVTFDTLPRLTKLMFESGVIDELLFLDVPEVCRFPSGLLMLKYGKAVQETVYENFRVVHEGQLRIVFTQELKILSWEFCASCHEVLVPRCLAMSEMVHAVKGYRNVIDESKVNGVLQQDSQEILKQIQAVGCWFANAMDSVDDLGFSKSYTRCLQIAEIVRSMKDLMTFSQANQMGPIDSFRHCYQEIDAHNVPKWEMQEKQHLDCRDLSAEKFIPAFPFASTMPDDCLNMVDERFITAYEKAASPLPGFRNKFVRVDQILDSYPEQVEAGTNTSSKLFHPFVGPKISSTRSTANFAVNEMSSLPRHGQRKQQHLIQQIMQEAIDSRTVNEFARQVMDPPSRAYNSTEAVTACENELRTSNSWAAFTTDSFRPAVAYNLSMNDLLWKQ